MGYNTYICMEAYDARFGLEQAFQHELPPARITEIANAISAFNFPTEGFFGNHKPFASGNGWELGDCRWYSQGKDMRKLSMAFPDVLFVLNGNGDETTGLWTEYWNDGAYETNFAEIPPFDPLNMTRDPEEDSEEASTGKKTIKYEVTVTRGGSVWVKAASPEEAREIAKYQWTDSVHWYDDWDVTDVFEDNNAPDSYYVTEKAFN